MEGEGYPKLPESSSGGGASDSKLPLKPLSPKGSMPPPAPAADKSGASGSKSKDKEVLVDEASSINIKSNNNNNKGKNGNAGGGHAQVDTEAPREQDKYMPIANVIRLMRKILPTHAKISDDAKECVQECVSEYISFITGEANDRCRMEQRKTITAEDLLWAMSKLGFDDYVGPLTLYLQRYRNQEGEAHGSARGESLPPIKRTASDAGLYVQPAPTPPQYPSMAPQGLYPTSVAHGIPYTYIQQPHAFFLGAGGSNLVTGGQGLLPHVVPPPSVNYFGPEVQGYRDMPQAAYRDGAVYPTEPMPTTVYRDVSIYRDVARYKEMAGESSSSQAAGPSQEPPFDGFDPYAPYK